VTHEALLLAVHVHPLPVITVTGAVGPPLTVADSVVGLTEYEHDGAGDGVGVGDGAGRR
jgi:hypothetical protein